MSTCSHLKNSSLCITSMYKNTGLSIYRFLMDIYVHHKLKYMIFRYFILVWLFLLFFIDFYLKKNLDGVGPVDNRPSTDKLHRFVQNFFFFNMWYVTHYMWHVTWDIWHMTHDTWHVTCDMLRGVNIFSKFQLPSS